MADVDGTLLIDDKVLTESAKAALRDAKFRRYALFSMKQMQGWSVYSK